MVAFQQLSHFSDNKHHSKIIDGMTVDIGTDINWTLLRFLGKRNVLLDGEVWIDYVRDTYYKTATAAASATELIIPKRRTERNTLLTAQRSKVKLFTLLWTRSSNSS